MRNDFLKVKAIKLLLSLYLIFGSFGLAHANDYELIKYNLSLVNIKNSILEVETILNGRFEDEIILDLPFKWIGENIKLFNLAIVSGQDFKIIEKNNNYQLKIKLPEITNKITIKYELSQQNTREIFDVHEAIIRQDLVHVPGYLIFATPADLKKNDLVNLQVNWKNIDQSWKILSSYGTKHSFETKISMPKLLHALYLAGKTRIYEICTKSNPVFVSIYGEFDFDDKMIVSSLEKVILSQRKFFDDYDFPYYAVSLIEGKKPRSMGGTALSNVFAAYVPKNVDFTEFITLFAHEHLHNWFGGKISIGEDERLDYWWSEGFTDFYARLLTWRSSLIDMDVFIKEINETLEEYYLSPVNEEPNSKIKEYYWKNYDLQKLPYYRGLVFAIYLNDKIKGKNPNYSLDNIILDLRKKSSKSTFSARLFAEIANQYVNEDVGSDMLDFIDQGKIINLDKVKLPMEIFEVAKYQLGFDEEKLVNNHRIENIDVKSAAYQAGIRNGMEVISYDLFRGQKQVAKTVKIETKNQIYEYRPEHYQKNKLYQIKSNLSDEEKQKLEKFFSMR